MHPAQLKRIWDYFIEEAREHLHTIEVGLLNLQTCTEDIERVNELYRAAHYIKGGAAMLDFNNIHTTAQILETCFRQIRENPVRVDEKLKSLLVQVFDTLQQLVEQVGSPVGKTEQIANPISPAVKLVSTELNNHLELLIAQASKIPTKLTLAVHTPSESITLSGYSTVEIVNQVVSRVGGTIVHRSWDAGSNSQLSTQIEVEIWSFSGLEALQADIQSTGGTIEIVQIEPRSTDIDYVHECFDTCKGCRYYYGRWDGDQMLICAVHPNGPEEENCRDWQPRKSETAQNW